MGCAPYRMGKPYCDTPSGCIGQMVRPDHRRVVARHARCNAARTATARLRRRCPPHGPNWFRTARNGGREGDCHAPCPCPEAHAGCPLRGAPARRLRRRRSGAVGLRRGRAITGNVGHADGQRRCCVAFPVQQLRFVWGATERGSVRRWRWRGDPAAGALSARKLRLGAGAALVTKKVGPKGGRGFQLRPPAPRHGTMDGLALAHRTAQSWPWIALLIASGRAHHEHAVRPAKSRFLTKPYTPSHVVDHIPEPIMEQLLKAGAYRVR
jgi:hypothetical protein